MRFPRKRGATSVRVRVFIPDNSVATGAGCTGLTYASTNLAVCYSRENDNGGTEVTGANILDISTIGTWADPGAGKVRFKAVDATKLPGLYEIHFPDAAAFGTGDTSQNIVVNVYEKTTTALKIGPNMVLIPLSTMNVLDGESNAIQVSGTTQTARDIGASVLLSSGTGTGQISLSSGAVTAGTVSDKTGYSLSQTFPTNFSSMSINSSGHVTLADASLVTSKLGTFALAKTTNITGFNDIAAADVVTALGTGTTLTALPWNAAWDAEVQSEATDALNAYDPPTNTEMAAAIAGTGTGANTVTITVNDGTDPIPGARVRLTYNLESYVATTNGSGVVTFNVNNGTWTVAATMVGYSFSGTSLSVTGNATSTVSMSQTSIDAPSSPDFLTGVLLCVDGSGVAEANVLVHAEMTETPTSGGGYAYTERASFVSDANGLVELPLLKGATYRVWRESGTPATVNVPSSGLTYTLPDLIGRS